MWYFLDIIGSGNGLVPDSTKPLHKPKITCQTMRGIETFLNYHIPLTHWGRVTHICVGNLTIIGSDNGLSPGRRQAITWTNVGVLLIGPLGTNFSEMLIEIHTFSFKKIHLKMSSGKWWPFCLGLNVLTYWGLVMSYGIKWLGQHWFRWMLGACSSPSHYLNQYWLIVKWAPMNNLQWIWIKMQ